MAIPGLRWLRVCAIFAVIVAYNRQSGNKKYKYIDIGCPIQVGRRADGVPAQAS